MKKNILFATLIAAFTAFANAETQDEHAHDEHANCTDYTEPSEHSESEHAGVPVKISDRARESIVMQFETISQIHQAAEKIYYGQMTLPPNAVRNASLPANGRVKFFVHVGEKVVAGTPLYSLASPDLIALKSDIKDAEASLKRSRAELATLAERLKRIEEIGLKNSDLAGELNFKTAEIESLEIATERSRALWNQATAGATFKDGELIVPAQTESVVQTLDLNEGAWAERGTSALTLAKFSAPEFKGVAFGNDDFSNVDARLAVQVGEQTHLLEGTLRIAAQIDETTQARTIYFTPKSVPAGVYAGQVAYLQTAKKQVPAHDGHDEKFVLVPASAVIKVGVDDIVFVCDEHDKNTFFARKVTALPSRRGKTPIAGIHLGEKIVVKGGYELKYVLPVDGNAPAKKTAGHFHADGKFHEGEH